MRTIVVILFVGAAFSPLISIFGQDNVLTDLPEVRGPFTLTAVHDVATGRNAFAYDGHTIPPLIRVSPGGAITLRYVNDLPIHSDEACVMGPCANISNLHFHGLHVSPQNPQDDVLTMISSPGETLNYKVVVPSEAPPGLVSHSSTRRERSPRP
jgi:suppressor of ftsI